MSIEFDDVSKKSLGGTEIIKYKLQEKLPLNLLNKFQIVCDRVTELDQNKIRLFWAHLTPKQNESMSRYVGVKNISPLSNGGWKNFHKIICVSYYQMEQYAKFYNIPYSHFSVLKHAIDPIEVKTKPKDKIVFIYNSNPSRGLKLLVPVFEELCKEYNNIELKVHSSWKIYGQHDMQKEYEKSHLYARMEKHSMIRNIGFVPNDELKKSLSSSHIFAYPSIWEETFCLSLLEAMSAGCLCVHSSLGALPETSSNWSVLYQYQENPDDHMSILYDKLKIAIKKINSNEIQHLLIKQKDYIDHLFNWDKRIEEWTDLLKNLENSPTKKIEKNLSFSYK